MDKAYKTEFYRTYLIDALPEPLTRASRHLQIFDNYITNTRMRLRSIRTPETKAWTYLLQQSIRLETPKGLRSKSAEMHLDEAEHAQLEIFEGNEIRKNRYFHEFDSRMFAFDVYLGTLWGVNRTRIDFENEKDLLEFRPPPFAVFEITNERFFDDANLVNETLESVREAVANLTPAATAVAVPDE
ncbi:MAG: hypothetical protein ACRD6X_09175 [Pyrinomonadaceae bacterium]